jgi:hypothetical protein
MAIAMICLSARLRGERVGVRWAAAQCLRHREATSPSHAFGVGPSLSPRNGGEGQIASVVSDRGYS